REPGRGGRWLLAGVARARVGRDLAAGPEAALGLARVVRRGAAVGCAAGRGTRAGGAGAVPLDDEEDERGERQEDDDAEHDPHDRARAAAERRAGGRAGGGAARRERLDAGPGDGAAVD